MADNGNEQETIRCTRCKKLWFVDGFRVNRLGRRNTTCLECCTKKKVDRERVMQDPAKAAKMKAAAAIYSARSYELVKNDATLLAARRLQQVLSCYAKEFPNDRNQPTTQEELDDRREWQRLTSIVKNGMGNGALQRRLDRLERDTSPQQSKDLAAKLRTVMIEVELGF